MKLNIRNFFSGLIGWGRDHKSDLKMAIGTTGVVGGTVLLCKESIRAKEIIDNRDEDESKLKTAGKVALTVLPGAVMEAAGLGLMWNGYSNTKAALVGVCGFASQLQESFDRYREGVREKYGEEEDERLAYQFREEEIVVQNDDGTETTETVKIYPHDVHKMPSLYARYFVYGEAEGAEHSDVYNEHFLAAQEKMINNRFRAYKKMMLNDVYEFLGIRDSEAGYSVGWVYDPQAPEGDNQIKLRARKVYREKLDSYGNPDGFEKVWMIDPNVDGMVLQKMKRMGLIDA